MQTAFREAHTNTPVYYFELMSSGSYAKLLEQKNVFTEEKGLTLTGLVWNTIMATFKFIVRTSVRYM